MKYRLTTFFTSVTGPSICREDGGYKFLRYEDIEWVDVGNIDNFKINSNEALLMEWYE